MAVVAPAIMDQNNMPAWGSYLYQNFLLPALSPNIASQWLTSPFGGNNHNDPQQQQQQQHQGQQDGGANLGGNAPSLGVPGDYFGSAWQVKPEPGLPGSHHQQHSQPPPMLNTQSFQTQPPSYSASQQPQQHQPWSFFGASIPTSLLTAHQTQHVYGDNKTAADVKPSLDTFPSQASGSRSGSAKISPNSVDVIDEIVATPSPILSSRNSPHQSPKKGKRRALSIDSNDDHYGDEQDHEVPEGVERDGMIWGMRVEDYRALSARERKRVRNRISARTFRAKRKEHLSSLETTLNSKDLQIKVARDDAERLRREVENLKRRLSKYEKI